MPDLASDFCESYRASANLDGYIADPKTDPERTFEDFLRWYGAWESHGAHPALADMFFWFHSTADAERALLAGRPGSEGRVRQTHCDAFVEFVNTGGGLMAALRSDLQEGFPDKDVSALSNFEVAMRSRQSGTELDPALYGLLNGACFLFNGTGPGGEAAPSPEFYAIPGRLMLTQFRRDLQQTAWQDALQTIREASEEANLYMANIDIALQLRLGQGYQPFPPGENNSGFVIFGGE